MDNRKSRYNWTVFAILAGVIVALQSAYFLVLLSSEEGFERLGQFGDMFGALTSLFSGLAFAGMISTLVMQTKELGFQREELELTREVHQHSAKAQAELVTK